MIVPDRDHDSAVAGGARVVRVPQGVRGSVDPGALAIPEPEDSVDLGAIGQLEVLSPTDRGGCQLFIDRGS